MRVFPLIVFSIFLTASLTPHSAQAFKKQHGLARHGDLKYKQDFTHFDFTNPEAPKGGILKLGVVGSFDSTNPFLTKGSAPVGLSVFSEELVFESLMKRAYDEPFSVYAWLAESVEIAPDHSWILFHMNPEAKWENGTPVTPDDVIFTHRVFKDHAAPNFRRLHSKIKSVERVGKHGVKFTFNPQEDGQYNSELPYIIAIARILPKYHFETREFEKTSLDFIPGSGAYKIAEVKPGHRIIYERRDDYWAKDLNVNKGMGNFDRVVIDYYLDLNVARMAFQAGEFDYFVESKPDYQKALLKKSKENGAKIVILTYDHAQPVALSTYAMNTRKPLFQDKRVRQALALAFDFPWINKNLFHGKQKRNRSFFDNTELAHQGQPTPGEFDLLAPHKGNVPEDVFYKPYYPENFEGNLLDRRTHLKKAAKLLTDAGYIIQGHKLVHAKTKQPFEFELMLYSKESERVAMAFARSLKTLGITMHIRTLDAAQYETRRLKFDYDMILQAWFGGRSPGNELLFYWGSDMAEQEGSRNYIGLKSQAIDDICQTIADAKDRQSLITACHAFDRLLMWGEYVIPLYYDNNVFVAHHKDFSHPEIDPTVPILLATWWYDPKEKPKTK